MFQAKDFLERFKNILGNRVASKDTVKKVLSSFNIEVKEEDILIKDKNIKIKCHPLIKGEISMNKDKIIQKIKESGMSIWDIS